MFLKRLCAQGFKSIGNYTEVDLINDVNVIMGPNGSGKSNFFECIQWVLGGMTAKQLRAGSMEDVIFDGGESGKAANIAEATLIFDNVDRELDIDSDEVSITRRLTRGKGTEYFINGSSAKLKELTTLFMNKGIGKNNYAITGQNRITEFAMMKPDDIRGVVEEAAGISGFKAKKQEMLNSVANYNRDIERIDAVISEIMRSIKPLQKQIKNATIYEGVKKELDERRLFYYSEKIKSNKDKILELEEKESSLVEEMNVLKSGKCEIDQYLSTYDSDFQVLSSKLNDLELEKNQLEGAVLELEKDKIMKQNTLDNLKEKYDSMIANIKSIEESSSENGESKQSLFEVINESTEMIASITKEIDEKDLLIKDMKSRIASIESFLNGAKGEEISLVVEIEKREKDIEVLLSKRDSLKNKLVEIEEKESRYGTELNDFNKEIDILNASIKLGKDSLSKIKEYENKMKSLENIINASNKGEIRKRKALEVKSMISSVKGFNDVLFNMISYDDKYTTAIEALYGGVLCNFVVEDVEAATQCVAILKKNKVPPANFIVASKIKKSSHIENIDGVDKVSDVLDYNESNANLILDYFGNAFFAKDDLIAEKAWNSCKQKYRVCTLEGTVYSANVIRGGYIQKDSKKAKKEHGELISKRDSLLVFCDEKLNNSYELKNKVSMLEKDVSHTLKAVDDLNIKIKSILSSKKSIVSEIDKLELSLVECRDVLGESDVKRKELIVNVETSGVEISDLKLSLEKTLKEREALFVEQNKKQAILEEQERNYYIHQNNSKEKIDSLKGNSEIVLEQIEVARCALELIEISYTSEFEKLSEIDSALEEQKSLVESFRQKKENGLNELNVIVSKMGSIENDLTKLEFSLDKVRASQMECEEASLDIPKETDFKIYTDSLSDIWSSILMLEKKIKSLGFINTDAVSEFKELNERYEVLSKNKEDLEVSKYKILEILQKMQDDMVAKYMDCYNCLKVDFNDIFKKLFNGGSAELVMENPEIPLESGIILKATPPGKKNKAISLLSGGEKSVAAVCFIFSLLKYSPSPVVIFDEIDAALDEINVSLIADYIKNNANVQYVIVSHRKPMMKIATALYGASMNRGVTELISQKL